MTRMGPRMGPNPSYGGASTSSIYTMVTAATVNAELKRIASTADDLTPDAIYNCDEVGGTLTDYGAGGYDMDGTGGALTVASAHGRAAPQVTSGACWNVAGTDAYNFGLTAFAFAIRCTLSAPPGAGDFYFIGKGGAASAHYGLQHRQASGSVQWHMKQSGAPTAPDVGVSVTDVPVWILAGRTVTGQLAWITMAVGEASDVFANTKDLSTTSNTFGLCDLGVSPLGGANCSVDHLLIFSGVAAENVYTNRVALVAALELVG